MFKFLFTIAALVALVAHPTSASDAPVEDEDVVVLTTKNFDETLKANDVVLVEFYAPWCGHCKRLAPEFGKAAKTLKDKGSKVVLGKVDAVAETELADTHKIGEFPTLFLFRNQKKEKFTGGRTADAIVEWIEKMTGPAAVELEGDANDKVSKETPVVYVGEFTSADSDLAKMFLTVANESRERGKFFTKVSSAEKIYCLRFEEGSTPYDGKTIEDLRKFVEEESFPLIGPINGDNFWKYNDREQAFVWLCGSERDFDENKAALREAAKDFRADHSFVWLDTDQFKGHAETALGLTEFPGFVVQKLSSRYIMPAAASTMKDSKKIVEFIKDVASGKIEKNLKSEPIPETNDEAVKVVVGKTFEKMIVQKDTDVFLEIYSPWCVYCKNFDPIYKEFAEKVKGFGHVLVSKMDGTANESPLDAFTWNSFPTIFFVKAGETAPMKFEGSRTVEGLMEFLEKNSSKPVKLDGAHDEL